jgi:DNA-binding response OmpR family regulator
VGEAARDYQHLDALLSAGVIVVLLPGPQGNVPRPPGVEPAPSAIGTLKVDLGSHRVFLGDREVRVSEGELRILGLLSSRPGSALSFAELAAPEGQAWLGDKEGVRSAIKRLRKKLVGRQATFRLETSLSSRASSR